MNKKSLLALLFPLVALAACSKATPLSTASLAGGNTDAVAPTAVVETAQPMAKNDPTSRALQVGTVSARAQKCGYNFDPVKLKASYLASEAAAGATSVELTKIEQVYNIGYNGVAKAVANSGDYCSEGKTKVIKTDLARHLAGDYSPPPPPKVEAKKEEEGILSSIFGGEQVDSGPKFGSTDWWDTQRERVGK